jgi:glycosyltransferase involved in cell wall biosynthesis
MKSALLAKRDEIALVRQADCTLVVSPVEKTILEEEVPGAFVHVVSNIHTVYGSETPFSEREGILFVGSFPHHPNVDAITHFCDSIDPHLQVKLPGVPITIIGSDPPDWLVKAGDERLQVAGHVPDIAPHFHASRLSIAPLRYGAGVKGKVLLSLAYGLPVIATSIAAEGIPVIDGRDMLIADSPEAFSDAIVAGYQDEEKWNRMSKNGLGIVEQHFSFSAARGALIDVFKRLDLDPRVPAGENSSTRSNDEKA